MQPKFMCPMRSEAKQVETLESGAEEGLLVKEVPTQKMGDLDSSQIHLAHWSGLKFLKGKKGEVEGGLRDLQTSWNHPVTRCVIGDCD